MIPPALLIHTCSITHQTPTGTVDAYGIPTVTTTTQTSVRCRFVSPKGETKVLESGEHVTALPGLLLPAGTSITEGDTVSAGPTGFDKTYSVSKVRAIYGPTALSHLKAELEAIS